MPYVLATDSSISFAGRAGLEGAWDDDPDDVTFRRPKSLVDMMPQSEEEMEAIRNAVVQREGLLMSVFDILRRVPRRLLMLLKLNDLVRYVSDYIPNHLHKP